MAIWLSAASFSTSLTMIRFSIAASRTGITVSKLNLLFRALLISFTPLSLVLAVPITLKPALAKSSPSSPSSGTFSTLSLRTLIRLSCISAGVRVISSKRVRIPCSMPT